MAASAFLVLRTKTNFNSKCWRKGLDPRRLGHSTYVNILLETGPCLIELRCYNFFHNRIRNFVFPDRYFNLYSGMNYLHLLFCAVRRAIIAMIVIGPV